MGKSTHARRQRVLDEMRRFLVLFLYLWVLFGLFALHERIILHENGLIFTRQGLALVNAFVLAKVMLVAEDLNIAQWLHRRPLIYPILHEAFVFAVVFICFHVLEHMAVGLIKGESIAASVPAIGGGGLVGLVCVAAILFVALLPYFAFQNASRALGPGRLNGLLFGAPDKAPTYRERVPCWMAPRWPT
ncbi:MAG: hypothetical protein JO227_14810 [Acetobacteraceae bacterium]|nr:hypothetical protein [Acetobacteraceae bacterium]